MGQNGITGANINIGAAVIAAHPVDTVFGRALIVAGTAFSLSQKKRAGAICAVGGAIAIAVATAGLTYRVGCAHIIAANGIGLTISLLIAAFAALAAAAGLRTKE